MKSLALAILAVPAAAVAACTGPTDEAMSCVPGTIWDGATEACEPVVVG